MKYCNVVLRSDEKAIYDLRGLYLKHGYQHYKVGKFEEYDLYAGNKSFLKSDSILTFTDTDGKLMALKPDVTLSIIKNVGEDSTAHKFFYNENVYRTSASFGGFREIMQTGLECIGKIDTYSVCEVLMLADESLRVIGSRSILALSHMGFVLGLLEECKLSYAQQKEALEYISSKNTHALKTMADGLRMYKELSEALVFAAKFYGTLSEALDVMKNYCFNDKMTEAYDQLVGICEVMKGRELYADFSLVSDMDYYNGIVFKGYIDGIPESILSGGQYDSLVHKMGKDFGAVGFAVYLDLLERFYSDSDGYDTDVLLVYGKENSPAEIFEAVTKLTGEGNTVKALESDDGKIKYKKLARLVGGEVKIVETND